MVVEKFIRYTGLAVGLRVFEKFIRYIGLAVGLKPSAMGCEARLRGLERIISSKTIKPAGGLSCNLTQKALTSLRTAIIPETH